MPPSIVPLLLASLPLSAALPVDVRVICELARRLEEGDHCAAHPELALALCEQELQAPGEDPLRYSSPATQGIRRRAIRLCCRLGQEDRARRLAWGSDWELSHIDWLMGRRDEAAARRWREKAKPM